MIKTLLLVLTGLLGVALWPNHRSISKRIGVSATKTELKSLKATVEFYRIEHGEYPKTLEALAISTNGKKALLRKVPKDPWGNNYVYKNMTTKIFIYSHGDPEGNNNFKVVITKDDGTVPK